MSKIKICPNCGHHNSPGLLECAKCEEDLTTVRISDTDDVQPNNTPSVPSVRADVYVRICTECGAQNPPAARKCQQCGEDISDVRPTPAETSQCHQAVLKTEDGYSFSVCSETSTVIGRDAQMADYLCHHTFVSRSHAELSFHDGALWVRDLGSTNHTFVNDEQIGSDPHRLEENDTLSLGGKLLNGAKQCQAAYFTVRYQ